MSEPATEPEPATEGYWVLPGSALRELLYRAEAGEGVGTLLLEVYANADIDPEVIK